MKKATFEEIRKTYTEPAQNIPGDLEQAQVLLGSSGVPYTLGYRVAEAKLLTEIERLRTELQRIVDYDKAPYKGDYTTCQIAKFALESE